MLNLYEIINIYDDVFSTRTRLERVGIAGPELELSLASLLALDVGLLCKNKKERGLAGARPLPL